MNAKLISSIAAFVAAFLTDVERARSQTPIPNMVWIQPGTFTMGSPANEPGRFSGEGPQTRVTISQGFWMGKHEVKQSEYLAVMGVNPSLFTGELNRPVEQVSWYNATNYCGKLTTWERSAGRLSAGYVYRLPTEAEWEYACRAATSTRFSFGDDLGNANLVNYGWYSDNSAGQTHSVGQKLPNPWGLYDMHGNLWEWCEDWFGSYPGGTATDPRGPSTGVRRIIRGGSWNHIAIFCRSAERADFWLDQGHLDIGFRVVLAPTVSAWSQAIGTPTVQPTYSACPDRQPNKDSLIVVTHGWNSVILNPPPIFPPDLSWVDSMSNNISSYLTNSGLTNWQVYGFKWLQNSWTFFPTHALNNAKQEGLKLGNCISTQGWSHIHLIGHSAGAGLIQVASEVIKSNSPNTTVHCTFLDAYVGKHYEGVGAYGKRADWSDSYFSRDVLTTFGSILTGPFTESPLDHAYNVNVTQLDPKKFGVTKFRSSVTEPCFEYKSTHGWPIDFYVNTITGTVTSNYAGFGFPLSKEGGNWNYALANYTPSNNPARILGPLDPLCTSIEFRYTPPTWPNWLTDFTTWPTVQSTNGSAEKGNGWVKLTPGSPVWLATFVSPTNPVNTVSFDAMFVSTNGSDNLLSVYWDTNVIGTVDEGAVQPGLQHYSFSFPNARPNNTYMFGLRLDPYTNTPSSIILTNVTFTQIGVSQPFSLSIVTNTSNGLLVYELAGEPGFEYHIHASTNLVDWMNTAILANTNGTVKFFDEASTNYSRRFYRGVAP